jgi:hypothetical protein
VQHKMMMMMMMMIMMVMMMMVMMIMMMIRMMMMMRRRRRRRRRRRMMRMMMMMMMTMEKAFQAIAGFYQKHPYMTSHVTWCCIQESVRHYCRSPLMMHTSDLVLHTKAVQK